MKLRRRSTSNYNRKCLRTVNVKNHTKLLQDLAMEKYNDNTDLLRKWGGGIMGLKTQAKLDKRAKSLAAEEAKKAASLRA